MKFGGLLYCELLHLFVHVRLKRCVPEGAGNDIQLTQTKCVTFGIACLR